MSERLRRLLFTEVSAASLGVFRVLLGALLAGGAARFMLQGWIEVQYVQPSFFFKYPGFAWVPVPGPAGLYALYTVCVVAALLVAAGAFTRWAALSFALAFTWTQLMDVTNYLNHYYLVVILAFMMTLLPLNRRFSVDAWRARRRGRPLPVTAPAWVVWLLRAQFAIVYLNAALAKVTADWLLHGQPMGIWMKARTELPVIGPLLDEPWVIFALAWAGFLYDLTIVGWLSWRRTRPAAYLVVLVFHGLTNVFFDIGLFPFIMTIGATLFFAPDWPSRLRRRASSTSARAAPPSRWSGRQRAVAVALGAWLLVQVAVPLRHLAIPGDVLWTEEGMRFSWKVMVREKNGSLTYHVRDRASGREWRVSPFDHLTWRQANEMSSQPDLILQLAQHVGSDFRARGYDVEVRAEAWVSLNGRPRALMVDPEADLLRVVPTARPAPWITPLPNTRPLRVW